MYVNQCNNGLGQSSEGWCARGRSVVIWKVAQITEIVLKLLKNWLYFTEMQAKRLEAM